MERTVAGLQASYVTDRADVCLRFPIGE